MPSEHAALPYAAELAAAEASYTKRGRPYITHIRSKSQNPPLYFIRLLCGADHDDGVRPVATLQNSP